MKQDEYEKVSEVLYYQFYLHHPFTIFCIYDVSGTASQRLKGNYVKLAGCELHTPLNYTEGILFLP